MADLPSFERVAGNGVSPDCELCSAGGIWSLSVYFPGKGELDRRCRIDYGAAEASFVAALGAAISRETRNQGEYCCVRDLYQVRYEPRRTVGQNAAAIARAIERTIAEKIRAAPWLREVKLHLVGFSAGGVVATHVAGDLSCRPRRRDAGDWCGERLDPVPLAVDLLTMATPFNLGHDSGFATTLRVLASIGGFLLTFPLSPFSWFLGCLAFYSTVPSFYGGRRPACLRRFHAYVSSRAHGDGSDGADQNPRDDERLRGWVDGVTRLAPLFAPHVVPHADVPAKLLELVPNSFDPGCRNV